MKEISANRRPFMFLRFLFSSPMSFWYSGFRVYFGKSSNATSQYRGSSCMMITMPVSATAEKSEKSRYHDYNIADFKK